ncbi:alpha/beta fold hydrolase [Nocardia sp. CDC153]|uniref:alpha/beta fold hydrolase n=1 Tax=Nocardia sp. CDC153 TaxID=3112167 RepID=UPI002DB9F320|nr:alpha/beta fold hydrolase [Nocardia sp. CDC153]MEC3956864.1 alpha/beta fold hydrolase [Nocardia sp. CDC153]
MSRNRYEPGWRHEELGAPGTVPIASGAVRYFERGAGEPIVLVHGAMVNANLWRRVVPLLARQFRVVTLDLPFGSHDHALPQVDLSVPGIAQLVIESLETLGLAGATLLANDTGGAVAQVVVAERPDLIGRLALTSSDAYEHLPPPAFDYLRLAAAIPGALLPILAPLRIRALRGLPIAQGWLTRRALDPVVSDSYVLPSITDRGVRRDLARVLVGLQSRHTLAAALRFADFHRPVLIAWSREDRFCPPANAHRLARDFPNARLEWIRDSYTLSPEDQPERVAALVSHFILTTETAESTESTETTEPGVAHVR